ncbi:uncharacterized protein [Epargyreus clarus]|uniref:uncharacterized protein isoform X2 n=1 Tax=Epargyreus clarus TaxID=520877 RepID=UPI003C2DBB43
MNVILVLVVALLVAERHVEADFMYNRVLPKEHELEEFGLKCIPGRTTIRIEEPRQFLQESESDDDEMDLRRSHMNFEHDNENCVVCVCSVEGKDEYCSRRPAKNVNECIRMSMIKEEFERNVPFSHERSLSHRIRRVGGADESICIPYVSEYTDCSEANACNECTRCTCDEEGKWFCETVDSCPKEGTSEPVDDEVLDNALDSFYTGIKKKEKGPGSHVPPPPSPDDDLLLGYLIKVSRKNH